MVRPLTAEEKARGQACRKAANALLSAKRKAIVAETRKLDPDSQRYQKLWEDILAINDVKGLPVVLQVDGSQIALDYDLLSRFLRKLRGRQYTIEVIGSKLCVEHQGLWGSGGHGSIQLHSFPQYQFELLNDLPVVIHEMLR